MAGNQSNEITALLWFDVFSLPPVVMFAMYFGGSGHLPRTCNSTSKKVWALIYILGSACISHVHAGSFKNTTAEIVLCSLFGGGDLLNGEDQILAIRYLVFC